MSLFMLPVERAVHASVLGIQQLMFPFMLSPELPMKPPMLPASHRPRVGRFVLRFEIPVLGVVLSLEPAVSILVVLIQLVVQRLMLPVVGEHTAGGGQEQGRDNYG